MVNQTNVDWLDNQPTYKSCRKCNKGLLMNRIPRGFFVKYVLFFLELKRYKCSDCGIKSYV